jgi:hypothetical protein
VYVANWTSISSSEPTAMVISVTWREFLRHCEIPREQDQPARKGSAKLGQERFALALLVVLSWLVGQCCCAKPPSRAPQ